MAEEISQAAKNLEPSGGGEQRSIDNIADEDLRLSDFGINAGQYLDTIDTFRAMDDPYGDTGTTAEFEGKHEDWEQSMFMDFASGVYNSGVDGLEGLANLAPTIVQAAGGEDVKWADQWKTNVTDFFDAQKAIYSDAAYKDIDGFGDINAAHVATGLGQAIGFVAQIMVGAGTAGALSKGGSLLSKAEAAMHGTSKLSKLAKAGKKAAHVAKEVGKKGRKGLASISDDIATKGMSKAERTKFLARKSTAMDGSKLTLGEKLSKAAKGKERAGRVGSFLTGTSLMYGGVEKQAREAGMGVGDAARFALGVSSLVSMTEGAALEWVGKIGTKAIKNKMTTNVLVDGLAKSAAKEFPKNPIAGQKAFMKKWGAATKNRTANAIEGAGVEFGQEFGQTYIEEGAKQLWDATHKGMEDTKGHFGADVGSYKSFVEAVYGGMLGAVIGGGMTRMGAASLGDQLAKESLFGYINNANEQNKPENIEKVVESYGELFQAGKITKREYDAGLAEIENLSRFSKDVSTADIDSDVAKYQLYQLDKTKGGSARIKETVTPSEEQNPRIQELNEKKQKLIEKVEGSIQENFDSIFDNKVPHEKDKGKFDLMIQQYQDVVTAIAKGDVDEKELDEVLKGFSPTAEADAKAKAEKVKENTFTDISGVGIPNKALDNLDAIEEAAAKFSADEMTEEDFYKKMETDFGLDKEQTKHLLNTKDAMKQYEAAKKKNAMDGETDGEDASTVTDDVITSVDAIKSINERLKKEFPEYDLSNTKEAPNKGGELVIVDKNGKQIPKDVLDKIDAIKEEEFKKIDEVDEFEVSFKKVEDAKKTIKSLKEKIAKSKKIISDPKSSAKEVKLAKLNVAGWELGIETQKVILNEEGDKTHLHDGTLDGIDSKDDVVDDMEDAPDTSKDGDSKEIKKEKPTKKKPEVKKIKNKEAVLKESKSKKQRLALTETDTGSIEALVPMSMDNSGSSVAGSFMQLIDKYAKRKEDTVNTYGSIDQMTEGNADTWRPVSALMGLASGHSYGQTIDDAVKGLDVSSDLKNALKYAWENKLTVEEAVDVLSETKETKQEETVTEETIEELTEDPLEDNDEITDFDDDVDEDFEQKKAFADESTPSDSKQLIKNNPELYQKIKAFFEKNTNGQVGVRNFETILDKIGLEAMARVSKAGIDINKNSAVQTSLIHEYAHIYMELLGDNHPLIKNGLELLKGSELHKLAQKHYPELSEQGQLKEAMAEMLAIKTLSRLETKFEGTLLDKIKAWLKRFWNRTRGLFSPKYNTELDKLVDNMMAKQKEPIDLSTMFNGYTYQKSMMSVDAMSSNMVQNSIIKAKADAITDKKRKVDPNKRADMRGLVYRDLLARYKEEKKADFVGNKIFDNVNVSTKGVKPKVITKNDVGEVLEAEKANEGISMLRKKNTKKHYGNPFLGVIEDNAKAVEAYKDWLTGKAHNEFEQGQRAWIRRNVLDGNLDGENLIYTKGEGKTHADVLANFVKSKALTSKKLRDAIERQAPNLFEITETSIDSVTKSSIIEGTEIDELTDLEGKTTNNAIKADKGFSPGIRSIVRALVDSKGKSISADEVFRYIAGVATNSLNVADLKEQLAKRATSRNVIADRLWSSIQSLPEGQQKSIFLEMSSVIQTSYKKAAHQKYIDPETGATFEKIFIRELNRDWSIEDKVKKSVDSLLTWNDTDVLQGIVTGYDGVVTAESLPGIMSNYALQFRRPDVTERINGKRVKVRNISEKERNDYNAVMSSLVGENIPRVVTDKYIDEGYYTDTREKSVTKGMVLSVAHQKLKELTNGTLIAGKNPMKDYNNLVEGEWDSRGAIRRILRDSAEDQYLTNSFVNSTGNNVTSTTVGYWITELNKRIFKDPKTQEAFRNSPIYRDNTILKLARSIQGKVNWNIHDAIDSNGNVKELSNQSKDDIILTQLMNFANDSRGKVYGQLYGVQGDRGHVTYFDAPRLMGAELQTAYANLAKIDEHIFQEWKNEKGISDTDVDYNSSIKEYVDTYNKSGMNIMSPNGEIYTPFDKTNEKTKKYFDDRIKSKVNKLNALVGRSKLVTKEDNVIGADHVGDKKLFNSNEEMFENFVLNEALNRQHLNNLYQGPIMQRKSIEDHIKRSLGTNSTGVRYEIDKPVVTVVFDGTSVKLGEGEYTSDSMSLNGADLHARLQEVAGDLINVGPNIKDQVYQVDPTTGKLLFLKMSTLGVVGEVDPKTGKRVKATRDGNNFKNMVQSSNNQDTATYDKFAEALFNIEDYYKRKFKETGDKKYDVYVKMVDNKAIKGNEGGGLIQNAMSMNDLIADSKSDTGLDNIINNSSFEKNYENYRIPFNLNKDLSQVPLQEQTAIFSTQLQKIALNDETTVDEDGNNKTVNEFEEKLVKLLKRGMAIEEGESYEDSKVYKLLMESDSLLKGLAKSSEESGKFSLVRLIESIRKHNKIEGNDKISLLDHPNLKTLAEQYVSSKLTKTGVRNEISGAFVQMIPDYGNGLRWNDEAREDGSGKMKDAEVAVPWSMYGKTKEAAEAYLAKRRAEGNPIKVVVVRVPASAELSSFAADVKYFTDGTTNAAVLPDEFTKMSDADHDGDKTFIYRENLETLEDGSTGFIDDIKSGIFWDLYRKVSSDAFLAKQKADLSTDEIKAAVDKVNKHYKDTYTNEDIPLVDKTGDYSLKSYEDVADVLSKYSFGADAIGIEAIAGKMLSMFVQSGVNLKSPVSFKGKDYKDFNRDQAPQLAKVLQAALDLGNDPILLRTGINKHTINAANAMLGLGVPLEEVVELMKHPVIQKMVEKVDQNSSVLNPQFGDKRIDVLNGIRITLSGAIKAKIPNRIILSKRKLDDSIYTPGQTYITEDGKTFFTVEVKNGKLAPVYLEEGELRTDNTQIIDDFIKFDSIGEEIKGMIGLAQADNQMAGNSVKLSNMKDSFTDVKNSNDNNMKLINAKSLMKRPLLKHYDELMTLQSNIESAQFLTEKNHFNTKPRKYKNATDLENDSAWIDSFADAIGSKGMKRPIVEQAIMRMVAAKAVKNVPEVPKFTEELHSEVKALSKAIKNDFSPPEAVTAREVELKAAWDLINDGGKFADKATAKDREAHDEWQRKIDANLEIQNYVGDNLFLRSIEVNKIKTGVRAGQESISPIKDYRAMTDTIKDEIRADFDKLPSDLKERFVNYQLLQNGVSDKLGSLIDMMPMSESIDYYNRLQKQAGKGFTTKEKLNVLLAIRSELPRVKINNNNKTYITTGWHRNGDNVVFTNAMTPVSDPKNVQIRKGNFYDDNNFVKFDTEGVSMSKENLESVEEVKGKCGL